MKVIESKRKSLKYSVDDEDFNVTIEARLEYNSRAFNNKYNAVVVNIYVDNILHETLDDYVNAESGIMYAYPQYIEDLKLSYKKERKKIKIK